MAVRIVTIVIDRSTPPVTLRLAWLPNQTQPPEPLPFKHPYVTFDWPVGEPGWNPSFARLISPQPSYAEQPNRWRHPPPTFEWPDAEPRDGRSWARFLGPQPSYGEQRPWWHKPPTFEWPEAEPDDRRNRGRYLGPQPSYNENAPWRHPSPTFEWPPVDVYGVPSWARFLGPQPNRAEQAPWRHPSPTFEPPEPYTIPLRGWFAGETAVVQVAVEYLPWRHKTDVPLDEQIEPKKSSPWRPDFGNYRQEFLPWRHRSEAFDVAADLEIRRSVTSVPTLNIVEQMPWRPRRIDPVADPVELVRVAGWQPGMPSTPAVVVDYLPWRHKTDVPMDVPVEPRKSNLWRADFVAYQQASQQPWKTYNIPGVPGGETIYGRPPNR